MLSLKSLTAKFIFIGCIMLTFFGIYVAASYVFTHHMGGEAMRMNLAGRERMLIRGISASVRLLGHSSSTDRNSHIKMAEMKMSEYEETLYNLRDGNDRLGLKPMPEHSKESIARVNALIELWQNTQKPVITDIMKLPLEKKSESCERCHLAVRNNLHFVDALAASIEAHHDKEMKAFGVFRFYALGFSFAAVVFIILYVRRSIIEPLWRLTAATKDIEKGNFDVRVETKGRDETGELSLSLNRMAQTLGVFFDEKTRHMHELDVLNRLSSAVSSLLSAEEIANNALDEMLKLEHLKIEKKGALFLADKKAGVLRLLACRGFTEDFARVEAVVPWGECLCGMVAKTGEAVISEDCYRDERHTRRYPEMTEHAHINLPLQSRGKVLGVLCLYLPPKTDFSELELNLYKSISDIIAVSLQNALNYRDVQKHTKELLSLADASNVILTAANPPSYSKCEAGGIYETICDIAVGNFGLKMAWLGLIEEGDYKVRPVSSCGFEQGYLSEISVAWDDSPAGMGPTGMAIKTKTPRVMHDMESDPRYLPWREFAIKRGYRSSMAAPLLTSEGNIIGVINLYSVEPEFFTRDRIRLFSVFANQAATAIENKRLVEGLEEEVMRRTAELEAARDMSEAANRAKSDFLANMSHELRTPLNSVIGFSEIMLDGIAGELNALQKENLEYINTSGKHLLSLINDILDLSKVEAGKLELELNSFYLKDVLTASLIMLSEKARKHGIKLEMAVGPEADIEIEADERKLKQIMFNLLSNAVKFTPDGGSVSVSARRVRSPETPIRRTNEDE